MHAKNLKSNPTEKKGINLNHRRTTLLERIQNWKARSPDGAEFEDEDNNDDDDEDDDNEDDDNDDEDDDSSHNDNGGTHAENISLPLPSKMPNPEQNPTLQLIEKELREAQAFDYLRALRKSLSEKIALQRGQKQDLSGQHSRTRSYAVINRISDEITMIGKRYMTTYNALLALGGTINPKLRKLDREDISAKNVFEYSRQLGRGSDTAISWIWRQMPVGDEVEKDSWLEEGTILRFLDRGMNSPLASTARTIPGSEGEP